MTWIRKRLSECTEYITDGDHQPAPKANDGIRFIKIKDIIGNRISFDADMYVPREYYDALPAERKAQNGDVLYTVVGSYGTPCFVDLQERFCFERNIALLHPNETIDSKFLYYAMLNPSFFAAVDAIANGSAQKLIPLSKLKAMEISVPALDIQRRIADILSAYDDLIENNQKQIKLLEEAAQRLYREWFVELHFPGHETTPVVDGVPEGWKKGHAEDFFNITIGKTPPRSESKWFCKGTEGIPWVSISDMGGIGPCLIHTAEGLTQEAVDKHHVNVCPSGTVLLSFKLTVGRVAITSKPMCTNEAIAHFTIGNEKLRAYAYCYLKEFPYDTLGSTSSISKAVNSKIVKAMPFIMPDAAIINRFSQMCDSLLAKAQMLSLQNERLCEARDRLLPKLMSGEVEV